MANQYNTFQNCSKEVSMLLPLPKYVKLVREHEELRDGVQVSINRYQARRAVTLRWYSYYNHYFSKW